MTSGIIYLVLPLFTVFPVVVAFVKWQTALFKNKQLALEFVGYFIYFIFNLFFAYKYSQDFQEYKYIFKIIDPLFLLFLIQIDLSYSINKKHLTKLLTLIIINTVLQFLVYNVLEGVYANELLSLFSLIFVAYIVFRIGREYYLTVYISKISRYFLIMFACLSILFDTYIFRFVFVSLFLYICLQWLRTDLLKVQQRISGLSTEQVKFKNIMSSISNSIKDFSNKSDAANSYLKSLCKFLSSKGAAIYEWNEDKEHFSCIAVAGFYFPLGIGSEKLFTKADLLREMAFKQKIKEDKSIIWKCGHNKESIFLSHSTDNMEELLGNLYKEVHSIILIPLLQDTELLGVLVVENKVGKNYLTESDFNVAKSFSNFAAIILSTSRIAEQKHENLRMTMELNSGNILQSSLFSKEIPKVEGIDISYFMQPAKEIGGDYYDFFQKEDKLAIVIGDVSGKGVSAGLIVAIMQTYLQNQYKKEDDLKKLIVDLNGYLSDKVDTGMFVTLLFFEWDSKNNKLSYVSCGHEHILHFHSKDKTLECIRSGGIALMMDSDIDPYIKNLELKVETGDSVVLYTDGVTETFNSDRKIFGLEGVVGFLEKNSINKETIEKLLPQTLENWRGDTNQTDDITCLLMQF